MRKISVLLLAVTLVLCTVYVPCNAEGAVLGTSFMGRVTTDDGAGFPGVRVEAINVTTSQSFSTLSGTDGNFTLGVNPGLYNVTASYLNYSANVSYVRNLVTVGQEVWANFTMSEVLCTLMGYVTNGTQPIYGATVTLLNDEYTYTGTSVNPLGQYVIGGVKPGTYTVMASKLGYYSSGPQPPIDMVRNVTKYLDFELQEQPAELNGRVVYQGDGVSGVRVVLSSNVFNATTFTDEDGNYSFEQVPAGAYTITFTKERYLVNAQNIGLLPFEVRLLDVELEYDNENNTQKFILGFDLAHSLMVIGLIVALITLVIGLYVNYKVRRKPDLLEKEKEKKKSEKE